MTVRSNSSLAKSALLVERPRAAERPMLTSARMGTALWLVVAIIAALLVNGFFSGSEIAILSMRKSRIEPLIAAGRRSARRLKDLQSNMDGFLATVQIGVT